MRILNRNLYDLEVKTTKRLPIIIAFIYIISTIASYFNMDIRILSIIGGMSILPILKLYLSSFTYKLCTHHRIFIYYIMLCTIIDGIDYYTDGNLFVDRNYYLINIILFGIFLILYIIFKRKYDFSHKNSSKIS